MTQPRPQTVSTRMNVVLLTSALALLGACTSGDLAPTQATAVRSVSQAVIATDMVVDAGFDAGLSWLEATLPPTLINGTISQALEGNWDPAVHTTVDPIAPQGWTVQYFAGATALSSAPTTPAGWATVSRVLASGAAQVEGLDGERQALNSSITAPPVQIASSFSGGSSGDGWDVFFDPQYRRVFNIHHHNGPASVMCRNLVNSTTCPGFPIALTQTSNRSTGFIDEVSNKLWQPTVTFASRLAWDCVDLTTSARCATPVVISAFASASTSYDNHIDPVVIGRKMYTIGFAAGGIARVTCLDMASGAECLGVQLVENGTADGSGTDAIGNLLYVMAGSNRKLDCFDTTTMARCPGPWPVQTTSTGRVHAVPSGDGVLRNVCADWQCWSATGTANTLPPGYLAYASAHRQGALSPNFNYYANMARGDTRVAWAADNSQMQCWDIATDAKCSPAFPIVIPSMYAARFDPADSDCIWSNGDNGIIRNYKISTGVQGCTGGTPKITFKASISIPRLGCDPATRVYEYKSFKLVKPNNTQFTSATLSIKNSTGAPLAGWQNLALPANGTIDLSTLSTASAGSTPTFTIAAPGFTDTTIIPEAEFRVTTGSTPQLCLTLSVPQPVCPTTAGVAGSATGASQVTTILVKGSSTLSDGGVTNYTDATFTPTVRNDPANASNCGSSLTVIARLADNTPVAGIRVFLLDGAGTQLLDGASQPVSAVSAADGTVAFSVWASSYRVRMPSVPAWAPASMTVTSGGAGTTAASGGVVTSNSIAVSRVGLGGVNLVVTSLLPVAPSITTPAAGALLGTATPTVRGACTTNATVEVFEGTTLLCTTVCSASAYNCVTSALADGSHTLIARQTTAAGTGPASSSRTFTTDTVPPPAPSLTTPITGAALATTTPAFSGSCDPGATVSVFEGSTQLCSVPCGASTFSCTSISLSEGGHTAVARQTDPAGNASPDTAELLFTVDTITPLAPVITAPLAAARVNSSTPSLVGSCETGTTVRLNEGALELCSVTCSGGAFACVSSTLSDGSHTVTATQEDLAGHVSPVSLGRTFIVDTLAPAAPVLETPVAGATLSNTTPVFSGTCETGATVVIDEGGLIRCSALCTSSTFSCVSVTLGEGSHTVHAHQRDAAGNPGTATPARTFTVDTIAPALAVITAPVSASITGDTTPTIAGSCENDATVNVYEGATLLCTATCTADIFSCDSSLLTDGNHSLVARQTDAGGNTSADSLLRTFTVDSTQPIAPELLAPTFSFTSDTTPAISGTCESAATVTVYDSTTLLCTVSCVAGVFSCTSPVLTAGLHTLVARQSDAANNPSGDSGALVFTVDTTNPSAPSIQAPAEGSSTVDTGPSIAGRCEPFSSVRVTEGTTQLCQATCLASGLFVCDAPVLAEGPHTVVATQTDRAGNVGPGSVPRRFIIDTAAPAAPTVLRPVAGSAVNDSSPLLSGSCESGSVVSVFEGSTVLCQATCNSGAFSCESSLLSDGGHVVTASQVDSAGNVSASSSASSFTIDTDGPGVLAISTPAAGLVTNVSIITVTGTCEAGSLVSVFEGTLLRCEATCVGGAFSCQTQALVEGGHTLVAHQTDPAGNVSANTSPRTVVVDTLAPLPPRINTPLADARLAVTQPVVTGTCETGSRVEVKEGTPVLCTATCLASTFACTSSTLSQGQHTLLAQQTDEATNASVLSEPRSFSVDSVAPVAPAITSPVAGQQSSEATTNLSGTAEPGTTITVTINGVAACTAVTDATGVWTCSASVPAGSASVTAVATDPTGNSSPPSTTVAFTQEYSIARPVIASPEMNSTVQGPALTVTGTSRVESLVVITDEQGATVCSATSDALGIFECTGRTTAGEHTLLASASWRAFTAQSVPVNVTVLIDAELRGAGCGCNTGSAAPLWMALVGGLVLLRRRRQGA